MIRRNKFGAVRTEIDGIKFDSKGEAARYVVLRDRQTAGDIADLETQVSYRLSVNGVKIADYRSDFRYRIGDHVIVEDFKSKATMTPTFRMKAKLMQACHQIAVKVVFKPNDI